MLEYRLTGANDCPSANEGLQITVRSSLDAPAPRRIPQFILNPGCVSEFDE